MVCASDRKTSLAFVSFFSTCTSTDLHIGDTLFCNPRKLYISVEIREQTHVMFLVVDFVGEKAGKLVKG